MKQFENLFAFDGIVKVYIPSTIDGNKPAKELQKVWTEKAIEYLSGVFGGCTVISGVGAWKDESGNIIMEDQNICYSFCQSNDFDGLRKVVTFAEDVCRAMKQYAVTIEFCGRAGFVTVE